jgi:hypothetical protein
MSSVTPAQWSSFVAALFQYYPRTLLTHIHLLQWSYTRLSDMFQSPAGAPQPCVQLTSREGAVDLPAQHQQHDFFPSAWNWLCRKGKRIEGMLFLSVTGRIGRCGSPPRDSASQLLYYCALCILWRWRYLGIPPGGHRSYWYCIWVSPCVRWALVSNTAL